MMTNILILACVVAVLCHSFRYNDSSRLSKFIRSCGTLLILLLPLISLLTEAGPGVGWIKIVYILGFSLSVVLLIVFEKNWQIRWPLLLVWPVFPLMVTDRALGLWISLILVEFLLFFAHQDEDKRSDYYKYALLRLLVIFQFFVFESLFFHQRTALSSEVFTGLLLILYLIALIRVSSRIVLKRPVTWLFLLAYLQYGILLVERLGLGSKLIS